MTKTLTLAAFIFPERIDWFLNYLKNRFKLPKDKVFCYKNLDDEAKLIVTFKLVIPEGERLNIKELFPGAIPIHKKGEALYTINALNRLIEQNAGEMAGNIDHKSVKIDWNLYQNKIILINGEGLDVFNIKRVF